jgi:hypothetical protein
MKKLSTFIIILMVTLLSGYSTSFAASYFSNDKALDGIFAKLEKEFLQYEKDEVIPLRNLGAILTGGQKPTIKRTSKKISDSQVKAAVQKALNDIRVAIEIEEERLGGFTPQDYKIITDHLTQSMFFAKSSTFGWDFDGKFVKLKFDIGETHEWEYFKGLTGNFEKMGKEKDEVDSAALKVKDKMVRYLNQSIQKGNKVSPKILEQLPGEVEKLFIESNVSQIVAGRVLASYHENIYPLDEEYPEENRYDGTKTIEELIESYGASISVYQNERENQKLIEYYQYPADTPSAKAWKIVTQSITNDGLSDTFTYGFKSAITLNELARLHFESKKTYQNIKIEDNIIPADSPDYIKNAFIYGMIDDANNLDKPLTRLEAARRQVNGKMFSTDGGWNNILRISDAAKIPTADQIIVSTMISGGMKTRIDKFEPQSNYTKEEAIVDFRSSWFDFDYLRGFNIPYDLSEPSEIRVGKNTIHILFNDKDEINEYFEEYYEDTALGKIKLTGSYTKIDTGGALIELFTPENGIKFTIKSGTTYFDLEEGYYGPGLAYKIEPKVIKSTDKVDMNMQLDTTHKKLYAKIDAILAKIIKTGMTQEQKVKAIHDYVVKHITYDYDFANEQTIGSIMESIDKGRGVCGDYSLLFMHLCKRASIPCTFEAETDIMQHAWNAVYVNGQWLFVDTTWDDDGSGKIKYTYFLKDRFTFDKTHFPLMGVPDISFYSNEDFDPMRLKNQDELRAYLLKNFYWVKGYKLTFRMADKNIKPTIGYMHDRYVNVVLTYDSKNNLYTVTAKGK